MHTVHKLNENISLLLHEMDERANNYLNTPFCHPNAIEIKKASIETALPNIEIIAP